jgi:hypothetical protein
MLAAKSPETNTWTRSATSKGDAERALADKEARARRRQDSAQSQFLATPIEGTRIVLARIL